MKRPAIKQPLPLPLQMEGLRPGDRVAVAVSGGADSVALLRILHTCSADSGLVLHVAHFHHGLRGAEANEDAAFVRELAASLKLQLFEGAGDTAARVTGGGESIEEAARALRYRYFQELLDARTVDVIVTGHTLDDQSETVVMKLLRGAWTEGLGGISPVVRAGPGKIVRPLLQTSRSQVELYLLEIGQAWREDSSNASDAFTRNRVRHELMPLLRTFNPRAAEQLARVAEIARDEEAYWQNEVQRLLPALVLRGKPVRGGGRSVPTDGTMSSIALDLSGLLGCDTAVQRRIIRAAARQIGFRLEFDGLGRVLSLLSARVGARDTPMHGLLVERSARELRLTARVESPKVAPGNATAVQVRCAVPGRVQIPRCGIEIEARWPDATATRSPEDTSVLIRTWKAGDRIRLRHTLNDSKVKEVLQRLRIPAEEKAGWLVGEWCGQLIWMRGAEVHAPADVPVVTARETGTGKDFSR